MEDGLDQLPFFRGIEHDSAESCAVDAAIGIHDAVAEAIQNFIELRRPGLGQPAPDLVGVNHLYAKPGKATGNGGFTATDAAGESDSGRHYGTTVCMRCALQRGLHEYSHEHPHGEQYPTTKKGFVSPELSRLRAWSGRYPVKSPVQCQFKKHEIMTQ